jgi:multiple sugar transport system substrate-binding protein
MKKVLLAMITCIMMILCAACNGNNLNDPSGSSSESETQVPQQKASNESNPSANTGSDSSQEELEPLNDKPKTIVVSILAATNLYKQAKQKYEAIHPNTTIELKEFPQVGNLMSAADVEKYVKTTTTEVLSGKGADLFAFTGIDLPIDNYVNKGKFVNLDEWIERDPAFDPDLYPMNIMEGSKMNGGLYIMPLEFYLEALFGDGEGIEKAGISIDDKSWTWSKFADISKQLAGKNGQSYAIGLMAPEIMVNNLVSDNYNQLVDGANGEASFDSPFFKELLEEVKKMYEDKAFSEEYVDFNDSSFTYSIITSPSDYLVRLGLYYKNGKVYQKPHTAEQNSGISFSVTNQIAMNANSEVKRDAWEFMKFLLSEEVQSYPHQTGFSMNNAVNERAIEFVKENGVDKNVAAKGGGAKIEASEEKLDAVRQMLSEASVRNIGYETTIQKIIAEEVEAFFAGQKSAVDVAKLIQNRVTTYLNE